MAIDMEYSVWDSVRNYPGIEKELVIFIDIVIAFGISPVSLVYLSVKMMTS